MIDLSIVEGFEGDSEGHNLIRQVVFLTLSIIMAIMYAIYSYSYSKTHEEAEEVDKEVKLTLPFSLMEQQRGAMQVIFPLVTFISIVKFCTFVVWKNVYIFTTVSALSIAIPVIVATVFIKVETLLLVFVAFFHVFNKKCTFGTIKSIKKVLHIIFWILQLFPAVLAVIILIFDDFYVMIGMFAILSIQIVAEMVIVNGLLLISAICYLGMILTSRHLDKSEVFQTFMVVIAKFFYFAYFFTSKGTYLDKLFLADFVNFDYLLLPMSILISYFVYSKPTHKAIGKVEVLTATDFKF